MSGNALALKPNERVCLQCARLTDEHERLERSYAAALEAMVHSRAGLQDEYTRLRAATDEAWLCAECARQVLQEHKRGHIDRL
jgi:hypothetical protein